MQYGQIIGDTFRILWREKKLWVFGLIGLALSSLLSLIASGVALYIQYTITKTVNQATLSGRPLDDLQVTGVMFDQLLTFSIALIPMLIGLLVSYIINLTMRAGTVREAAGAWIGESVSVRRGVRAGVSRMLGFFGVDVLWAFLPVIVVVGGYAVMFEGIFSLESSGFQGSDAAVVGLIGFTFLLFCCLGVFALLYAAVYVIFAPMMYQSLAQGRRSFGDALSEAWILGRANWGSLIILAILVWGISLGLAAVIQLFTVPFYGMLMGGWTERAMMAVDIRNPILPVPNYAILIPFTVVTAGISYLTTSFMQTFKFTLYAKVYGELVGTEEGAVEGVSG